MNALTYQNTQFDIVDLNGQKWLRSPQIAEALGYGQANRVTDLYNRNADEFTNSMTALVKLPDLPPQNAEAGTDLHYQTGSPDPSSQRREVRIFSLRGAHLLGMLANTEPAKDFRRWILDVLDNQNVDNPNTLRHDYLLVANPQWGNIICFTQKGYTAERIAMLLGVTLKKVQQHINRMEKCGIIEASTESQLSLI